MATINLPSKYFTTTWNEKPPASSMQDEIIFVSDIGPSGSFFCSNGTRWQPVGGQCLLAISTTSMNATGFTGESLWFSLKIPAGLMSANGQLELVVLSSYTSSANTKRTRVKFDNTELTTSGTNFYNPSFTTTANAQGFVFIRNDNSTTAQYGHSSGIPSGTGASAIAGTSGTINTAIDSYVKFIAELTVSTEFVQLESYYLNYIEG